MAKGRTMGQRKREEEPKGEEHKSGGWEARRVWCYGSQGKRVSVRICYVMLQ